MNEQPKILLPPLHCASEKEVETNFFETIEKFITSNFLHIDINQRGEKKVERVRTGNVTLDGEGGKKDQDVMKFS